jgi:hypothetical protein
MFSLTLGAGAGHLAGDAICAGDGRGANGTWPGLLGVEGTIGDSTGRESPKAKKTKAKGQWMRVYCLFSYELPK